MDLILEVNNEDVHDESIFAVGETRVMLTPRVGDEDYWLFKVKVSDDQAIIGFPKFMQIGIGFQKEDDWNTNLPSTSTAEEIYNHIKKNKGDASIPDDRCIEAIKMISAAAEQLKEGNANAHA
jgi:hypothetical protein